MNDILKAIGGSEACAIPEQLKPLIQGIIEGKVLQFALIVELDDGAIMDCYPQLDDKANSYAMLGAITALERDFLRSRIASRVQYVEDSD